MSNKKARATANKQLTELLLKTRADRGYSLKQAAYKTGLSHTYISQLERGLRPTPMPEDLKKIARGFKLDYELLMEKAGYLEPRERKIVDYDVLMYSDIEAFESLSEDERERILNSLRDQADYLIDRAKRNNRGV